VHGVRDMLLRHQNRVHVDGQRDLPGGAWRKLFEQRRLRYFGRQTNALRGLGLLRFERLIRVTRTRFRESMAR
jgi:hypothetical protein